MLYNSYMVIDEHAQYELNSTGPHGRRIIDTLKEGFDSYDKTDVKNPKTMSPLVLAYIGDTVYDLFVRSYLAAKTDCTAHGLHMLSMRMVCASAQARAFYSIRDTLTDAELDVFRRGRNAHIGSVPKKASIADYRAATGFEALLGFLLLSGEDDRVSELMSLAISAVSPLNHDSLDK